MKRRSKVSRQLITGVFLLVLGICVFSACGKEQPDMEPVYVRGSMDACLYEDMLFYYSATGGGLKYQNLSAIMETGLPLYSDYLAEEDEDPFGQMIGFPFMLVDEVATKKNKNRPVLILAYSVKEIIDIENRKFRDVTRIVSYETDSQKVKILWEIEDNIQSLDLYGDYIYYTVNEGELGWNIHRIDKSGKNHITMENPEYRMYRVNDIVDGRVYLSNGVSGMCSVNLDLEDMQCLQEDAVTGTLATVIGDDLVYVKYGQRLYREDGSLLMVLYDLYRAPLSDPAAEECLIPNIGGCMKRNDKLYYYVDSVEAIKSGNTNRKQDILYEYSFDTHSSREIFNITGEERNTVYLAISDRYVICREWFQGGNESNMVAFDIETGMERKVPY